jgi:hypothetical protein
MMHLLENIIFEYYHSEIMNNYPGLRLFEFSLSYKFTRELKRKRKRKSPHRAQNSAWSVVENRL